MNQPETHADWTAQWQPLIDRVGQQLDDDEIRFGPDAVEPGMLRGYLEPLEFDCALHYDRGVAQRAGHPDIVAPYTAIWTLLFPPVWSPGDDPTFDEPLRNAQPPHSPISDDVIPGAPETSSSFGTSLSLDFDRPIMVGERIGNGPRWLVECLPKQTKVGRGAFVTFTREVFSINGDRVAVVGAQVYLYNPLEVAEQPEGATDE